MMLRVDLKPSGPNGPVWPLRPHTAAKHQILQQYLAGWFAVLGQTRSRILFSMGLPVRASMPVANQGRP